MPTLANVVAVAPCPHPISAAGVAKTGRSTAYVGSPGLFRASINPDGSLDWETVVDHAQAPLLFSALTVDKKLTATLFGGHVEGQQTLCLPAVSRFDAQDGRFLGTHLLPQARKGLGVVLHPSTGRVLVFCGQDASGKVHADGWLFDPSKDGLFDEDFEDVPLLDGTGVPTAPALNFPQVVVTKPAPGQHRRVLVLNTAHENPSEIVRIAGQGIRMTIATDVTMPFAQRDAGACAWRNGFILAGGLDSQNQPTKNVVAWDGTPGTNPAIVGQLPEECIAPAVFAEGDRVYVVGGVIGGATVATALRLEVAG